VKKLFISLIAILCLFGFVSAQGEYEPTEVAVNLKSNLPARIKIVEIMEDKSEVDVDEIEITGSYVYKFTFSEPEIHIYKFYQVPGDNPKMKYDDSEYYVHVKVEHNEDTEKLEGEAVAFSSEDAMDKVPSLNWENEQPGPDVPTGDTTLIDIFETVAVVAVVLIALLVALLLKDRKKES